MYLKHRRNHLLPSHCKGFPPVFLVIAFLTLYYHVVIRAPVTSIDERPSRSSNVHDATLGALNNNNVRNNNASGIDDEDDDVDTVRERPSRSHDGASTRDAPRTSTEETLPSHAPRPEFTTGIHLVTTFFRGKYSRDRFEEILTVLRKNLRNPLIARVHVLWEDESPMKYLEEEKGAGEATSAAERAKLVLTRVQSQPTYLQLFSYVRQTLARGTIAILANGDIYFDDSLSCLRNVTPASPRFNWERSMGKRPFFSLTRRHAPECGKAKDYKRIFDLCESYIGSHDVFIFAPPVSPRIYGMLNHTQNQGLGAENVVIWELNNSGEWRGMNPCDLIKSYHLHCTNERAYAAVDESTGKRVFLSGKRFNNGTWKHGWIKPWHWRKTISCGYEMF